MTMVKKLMLGRSLGISRRGLLILTVDLALSALALAVAYELRFEHGVFDVLRQAADSTSLWREIGLLLAVLLPARLVTGLAFKLHLWSYKFSSLRDAAHIALAAVSGTFVFVVLWYMTLRAEPLVSDLSRGVVVLELLLSVTAMAAVRFTPRVYWMYRADIFSRNSADAQRTLIVGAGSSGEMLLRDLQRNADHSVHVVGFVDDDPRRLGHVVGGRPIYGTVDMLSVLVARHKINQVVIAIPGLPADKMRQILSIGLAQNLRFKILPMGYGFLQDRDLSMALREISPDKLLERDELTFAKEDDGAVPFDSQRLQMVAGAAGSIGSEVCGQLLAQGSRQLVMLDTDENGLYMLKRKFERQFPDCDVVAEVADIREKTRVRNLFAHYRPRDVFHAAARKHVPLMESAPAEAVKTNVLGTVNLAEAASDFAAERFVFMSTDKAVRPTSVMGATKWLGEQVMRAMDETSKTRFSTVRFGNVLDSAGSVVPLFREQIAAGGPVTLTHPDIRRFFMTISEAVGLVLRAVYGDHGQLCVLEMGQPVRIIDLARQMIAKAGLEPGHDIKIEITGLRPGEKLFEELLADGEVVVEEIDRKIRVVRASDPPTDLMSRIEELAVAAATEDYDAIRRLLDRLVPGYRSLLSGTPEVAMPAEVM